MTTGTFTGPAKEYGEKFRIQLIDGPRLTELTAQVWPPKSDDSVFRVMCSECGDVVTFPGSKELEYRVCGSGHQVARSLPFSTAAQTTPVRQARRRRKVRRRR